MAESKIEWTDRSDWNPIRGCTRVSPGCGGPGPHGGCYAEAMAARFSDPGQWGHGYAERVNGRGRWTGKVEIQWDRLELPMRWKTPAMIFASSTSDFFHEALVVGDVAQLFGVMIAAHHHRGHIFQVLTKRSSIMRAWLTDPLFWEIANAQAESLVMEAVDPLDRRSDDARATLREYGVVRPCPGIWLGVSVEDQARADERREDFEATPAAIKFVSYEPALGPVDWTGWEFVDQIISGGESGPDARTYHPDWFRNTRDFCGEHGIAYFHKQNGEWREAGPGDEFDTAKGRAGKPPAFIVKPDGTVHCFLPDNEDPRCRVVLRVGKKRAGRLLDGREWSEMPA